MTGTTAVYNSRNYNHDCQKVTCLARKKLWQCGQIEGAPGEVYDPTSQKLITLNEAQENLWARYGPIAVKLLSHLRHMQKKNFRVWTFQTRFRPKDTQSLAQSLILCLAIIVHVQQKISGIVCRKKKVWTSDFPDVWSFANYIIVHRKKHQLHVGWRNFFSLS